MKTTTGTSPESSLPGRRQRSATTRLAAWRRAVLHHAIPSSTSLQSPAGFSGPLRSGCLATSISLSS